MYGLSEDPAFVPGTTPRKCLEVIPTAISVSSPGGGNIYKSDLRLFLPTNPFRCSKDRFTYSLYRVMTLWVVAGFC